MKAKTGVLNVLALFALSASALGAEDAIRRVETSRIQGEIDQVSVQGGRSGHDHEGRASLRHTLS